LKRSFENALVAGLCLLMGATPCLAQSPVFLSDINDKVTIYDPTALQQLPLLNIGVMTFNGGIDTNFIGIVDPKTDFKRWLDYPFPNDQLQSGWDDLFFMSPVNNSQSWFTAKIDNALGLPLEPTDFANIALLDRELNMTHSITMEIAHPYQYHNTAYTTTIRFDSHDRHAFELNGVPYILAIGTRLEWYDALDSWMMNDSLLIRFTTVHVLNAETGEEMARWDPQSQGYRMEDFGLPFHLRVLPNGQRHYSHPHVNIINPYVDTDGGNGVSIYASARHPGTVTKLRWDGVSNVLEPEWMFGVPPHGNTPSFYLPTITTNNLDAPHGSSAYVSGDTTFIATYNNKPDYPEIGGSHQVYRILNDQAELIWQSPDIGVRSICKGEAKWSADGRFVLTTHGNCDGAVVTDDGMGGTTETMSYEKFNVWNPWNNTKVLGLHFDGSMYVALMDFIDPSKMLSFDAIDVVGSDSLRFNHPHPGFAYWTVGTEKMFTEQLTLSMDYLDSLHLVSAWIRTGHTGAWRVEEKDLLITSVEDAPVGRITAATVQTIGQTTLSAPYRWVAVDMLGNRTTPEQITTPGFYLLEAYDAKHGLRYRNKHVFVR